jgi:urea carboxylase-associated protein 2
VQTTSTTTGARDHARGQAAATSPYGPTVPARDAEGHPDGTRAEDMLWAETIGPGGYGARRLPRGATVRLTDIAGDACANVLLYSARNPVERLNVADTVKVQWQAYLGAGALLLSDQGRVLMSIVTDTSTRHDALCGVSTMRANTEKYGSGDVSGPHPNGRDQFAVAVAKFGLTRRDIVPNVNFFKHVRVRESGELWFDPTPGGPGAFVELRAEQPVYLVIANTPHVLDPRTDYVVAPVRVEAWRALPTTRADALWAATPEGERAFLNTEDALLEDDA